MPEFLAVKRLTRSDLTFFEWHHKRIKAGNQKAINLNADVFEARLYPHISSLSSSGSVNVKIALQMLGPGLAPELVLTRKILKGTDTYKNWRLDGEFIYDPVTEPDRFHSLDAGDFVMLGFSGSTIAPDTVRADFIAVGLSDDASLHAAIDSVMADASMRQLNGADLDGIIGIANPAEDHPIHTVLLKMVAEDELTPARHSTGGPRRRPRMTREQVERGKSMQAEVGYQGELLVKQHLDRLKKAGTVTDYEWASDSDPMGPYDFKVTNAKGVRLVDVKSTSLGFSRDLHLSAAELATMSGGGTPYDIYRVYGLIHGVGRASAEMRIARDVGNFGSTVLKTVAALPLGVTVDSVSVAPTSMAFDKPAIPLR